MPLPSVRSPRFNRGGLALLLAIAAVTASCVSGDTDPATDVTDKAATLHGHGSAGGQATQWWFKYGKTTGYGTETAHRSAGSGTNQQAVSERVTGLAPDTLYHYRICASNPSGSGCGKDLTLKTGSPGLLPGFQEITAFSGLEAPTAVRFAPDGRIFVAEKPGGIKVFDGLGDPTPTMVANLRPEVDHNWDRGLLGLALLTRPSPLARSSTRSTPTTPRSAEPRPRGTTRAPRRRAPPRTGAWTAPASRGSGSWTATRWWATSRS